MAVYQDRALERIRKAIPRVAKRIDAAVDDNMGESDTRRIVEDILVGMLGWDKYDHITGESPIAGGYADFILKKDGQELAVIEIKRVNKRLNDSDLRQARDYAANEGIEWVIVTNGDTWKVYRILFSRQGTDVVDIFSVKISDSEMKPANKAALLYLLSEEAFRKEELRDHAERNHALSGEQLAVKLLTPEVLTRLRIDIRKTSGHKVTNREVADALVAGTFRCEAIPTNVETLLRKISAAERR